MAVCLVGTLDTKGAEFQYIKDQIESNGLTTVCINSVSIAAGTSLQALRQEADRGNSITLMAKVRHRWSQTYSKKGKSTV